VCMVLDFGYMWNVCERWSVLDTGVTPVTL
jgi:hypothetical protein